MQTQYHYAQISDANICIGISSSSSEIQHPRMISIHEGQNVLGQHWDGKTWQKVQSEKPPPPNLSLLEFRQLFTLNERMTMDNADLLLPDDAIQAKVMIKTLMADLSASSFIDPMNPDILSGIAFLSKNNLFSSPDRGAEILASLRKITHAEAVALLKSSED